MSVGLVGVTSALILGLLLGGISGYFGGWIDGVIQRVIEFFMSIPTLPLWLGLAAAVPPGWESAENLLRDHADPVADRLDRDWPG